MSGPRARKPITRKLQYDDLYRLTQIDYAYPGGTDAWKDPFAAEDAPPESRPPNDPRRAKPSPHVSFAGRPLQHTFAYDWLGNTSKTGDDVRGFYDRSLGTIKNGTAAGGPYQLRSATNRGGPGSTTRAGDLVAAYDDAGNLTTLIVKRDGTCLPTGASCSTRFAYDWDEVGRLVRARRWDLSTTEVTSSGALGSAQPARNPDVDLSHALRRERPARD